MKQSPLIFLMMFIGCFQSLADQDNKRFVEFQKSGLTQTYDLSTVQMLQPGNAASNVEKGSGRQKTKLRINPGRRQI
jgi:hypothetical protein